MDTLARTLILGSGKYSLSRSWFFPVQCSPWLLVLLLGHAFFSIFSIGYILCIYILSKRLSHAKLFSCVWLFATPWTVAHQAPQSTGFSRQEYPSGLPCPPPGDLPNPGIELVYPVSPTLQARTTEPRGKPTHTRTHTDTHTHTHPLGNRFPLETEKLSWRASWLQNCEDLSVTVLRQGWGEQSMLWTVMQCTSHGLYVLEASMESQFPWLGAVLGFPWECVFQVLGSWLFNELPACL